MMEIYFLWRLSMVLITLLAFSVFVAIYNIANKVLRSKVVKESKR